MVLDAFCIAMALGLSFFLRFKLGFLEVTEASALTVQAHAVACVLWLGACLVAMGINRLYDEDTLFSGGGELSRLFRSGLEATAALSTFVFITQSFYVSRSWFGMTVALTGVLLMSQRIAVRHLLGREHAAGRRRRPAVLVSGSDQQWTDWPFEQASEFDVVARIDAAAFSDLAERAPSDALADAAVVLRARDFTHDEFWRVLLLAGQRGWSVFVHSPVRSVGRDRLTLREVAGQTIVKVSPPVLTGARALQKRLFDIAVSATALVVISPMFAAIALAVALTSGRPILYRQGRVGQDGKPFEILKFRTMRNGAEDGTGPVWATTDDGRRTRVGRYLRRSSLDELPQLWNVLKGNMSIVGPRPERPTFVADFEKELTWYRFRHRMRPGITGWAQSHGLRGNTSIDSRIQYDNWYIENWSIWLDIKILLMTVREIVRGENAY